MARYVWRGGRFVDPKTGEPMQTSGDGICTPYIASDLPDYRSPVDGRMISGRYARREDLKRNDCIEADPPKKKRGFKNPHFCKKHGVPLAPEHGGKE